MRIWSRDGELTRAPNGAFIVDEYVRYTIRSDVPLPSARHLRPLPGFSGEGWSYELVFERFVGKATISGERFEVRNAKIDAATFRRLLDDVTREMVDLAFSHGVPTSAPSERTAAASAPAVPYHAFAYLKANAKRDAEDGGLVGQFEQIARQPHRRTERQRTFKSAWAVSDVGPEALIAVPQYPEHILTLSAGAALRATQVAAALGDGRFPCELISERHVESFDTHENRLVRAFLEHALGIVDDVRSAARCPELQADARNLVGVLLPMLRAGFLKDVGRLHYLPVHSTVLQRRGGYRQVRDHYLNLLNATRLGPPELWRMLLELKDVPTLYELWCFFQVKNALDAQLGPPEPGLQFRADTMQRCVVRARLTYAEGVELSYNQTFGRGSGGSYSVELRPDITISVDGGGSTRHLVLDAKLRFQAEAHAPESDDELSASPLNDDLQKMHVYREAIAGVEGAFVLFPGTEQARFAAPGAKGRPHFGIGALPIRPGEVSTELGELVCGFVG